MKIKQISIFLENRSGRLAEVTEILYKENINIRALSLADTADFGVLRIIVNDPDECLKILKQTGFVARETDVLAVEIEDKPGGLFHVLDTLNKGGINVEYMYAFVEKKRTNAVVIFKIDDQEKAVQVFEKNGIALVSADVLNNL